MPAETTFTPATDVSNTMTADTNKPACPLHETDDFVEIERNEACLQGVDNGN